MKDKKGFTLIELLCVILVIGLLLVIIVPKVVSTVRDSKVNGYEISAKMLVKVLNTYAVDKKATMTPFNGCIINYDSGSNTCTDLEYSGESPVGGKIIVNSNGDVNGSVVFDDVTLYIYNGLVEYTPRVFAYGYSGNGQTFNVDRTGNYKVELWGAQGGFVSNDSDCESCGKGSYVSGVINLTKGEKLYVYVGGQSDSVSKPGYNGGGVANSDGRRGSGGGATDIRLVNGDWNNTQSLASRIIVAAGGGGGYYDSGVIVVGGAGGTLVGKSGNVGPGSSSITAPLGGNQTSGGAHGSASFQSGNSGSFGKGGDGAFYLTAGGGGYYGGGGSSVNYDRSTSGAGGSSYISGYTGCVAVTSQSDVSPKSGCTNETTDNSCSVHYSNKVFTEGIMISGDDLMPSPDGLSDVLGNPGNGFVKITYIS